VGKERSGGCGAGVAILIAGTLLLGLAGGMAYLTQARRHEVQRVMLEEARQDALAAREAELRAEALRAERAAQARAKQAAELEQARRHEAEQAERFAREAEDSAPPSEVEAPADSAEAAPGVRVGVAVRVFRQGKLTGVEYLVLEVRGSRARVRRPDAKDEVQTWIDFAQIPRYDLLTEK